MSERLEEGKDVIASVIEYLVTRGEISTSQIRDIYYIIQQAELYEECRADAIRMHNALVFYSNENNYDFDISLLPAPSIDSMIIDDYGETARKALGVETIKDSESE